MQFATTAFQMDYYHHKVPDAAFPGWRGSSPELGDVWVSYPYQLGPEAIRSVVRGENIPTVLYDAKGAHVTSVMSMPTLNFGTLKVGEEEVAMSRNRLGLSQRGRALHMTYRTDTYMLWAIDTNYYAFARKPSGERTGVTIEVRQHAGKGRLPLMRNQCRTVTIDGHAEPTDLALAVMFSGVDCSTLTPGGAVKALFARGRDLIVENG
ncbi:hypothetical protein [Streptomyces sp. NPDC049906]|uniref:hypothetical protein n=1 Tax=Streptomyces sp. NPDC049906 TaxID=3155656 RepID=UPI00342DFE0F